MSNPALRRSARRVQCPSCFTLNFVEAASQTIVSRDAALPITCVLCGKSYRTQPENYKAAA